jgi:molybdopterin-containing oxidoreductase family iron-sulfur binding subunit
VPYVRAPEAVVPGKPLFFATAVPLGGYATGVVVESHMGRPIKVEGNPDHPASLGATDAFAQASVLELYDPDRSQVVTRNGRISTWDDLLAVLVAVRQEKRATRGAGLRILTETVTSPTLARQIEDLLGEFPEARWHQHEPVGREAARAGMRLAFGADAAVESVYDFTKADVILALDADFLARGPSRLRDARAFASRREVPPDGTARMNRLYVVEGTPTITGAMADHRWPTRAHDVLGVAQGIARALGLPGAEAAAGTPEAPWIAAVAADLKGHAGAGLVLAGDDQPPAVHALAHALNHALGNVGPDKPLRYIAPVAAGPGASLAELVRDMNSRAGAASGAPVDTLVILGSNPVYSAPADLDIRGGLAKVARIIHLGLYEDETAAASHWHVPEAHFLEAWGDVRAFDGTATIQQPLIAPLYGGKTASDLLDALLGRPNRPGEEIVREYWKGRGLPGDFEASWRTALRDGVVAGTRAEFRDVAPQALPAAVWARGPAAGAVELVFRPDPTVWDGRFANNGWLQELPKPLTKLTWDNAALISPRTAGRLGLKDEDVVALRYEGPAETPWGRSWRCASPCGSRRARPTTR